MVHTQYVNEGLIYCSRLHFFWNSERLQRSSSFSAEHFTAAQAIPGKKAH